MRSDWAALPESVMAGIAERIGGTHTVPAASGDHAEIAASVSGRHGKVFIKAARSALGVRSLRYEMLVRETARPPYSPAVAWHFNADEWLVVAFEHLVGRHADLSPGSPDLDLLGAAVNDLAMTPAPARLLTPVSRLAFDVAATAGETLVHTDLNPVNVITTRGGLRIVDWAMANPSRTLGRAGTARSLAG